MKYIYWIKNKGKSIFIIVIYIMLIIGPWIFEPVNEWANSVYYKGPLSIFFIYMLVKYIYGKQTSISDFRK